MGGPAHHSRRQLPLMWLASVVVGALAGLLAAEPRSAAAQDAAKIPLSLRRYRAALVITSNDSYRSQFSAQQAGAVEKSWAAAVNRRFGTAWDPVRQPWPAAWSPGKAGLNAMTPAEIEALFPATDVVMVAVVGATHEGFAEMRFRMWQSALQELSPPLSEIVADGRLAGDAILSALRQSFRPVGQLQTTTSGELKVHLQAAELTGQRLSLALARPGDLMTVTTEKLSRDGHVASVYDVPLTFLVVETVRPEFTTVRVLSGLRNPLPARSRGVLQQRVTGVVQPYRATSLRLTIRGTAPPQPFPGLKIVRWVEAPPAAPEPEPEPEPEQKPAPSSRPEANAANVGEDLRIQPAQFVSAGEQLSDRRGRVLIVRDEAHAVLWLSISSGSERLGRIPFVPGWREELTLELPDDRARLDVESRLASLQSELVDTVAARTALVAQLKRRARLGDAAAAIAQLKESVETFPTLEQFLARVSGVRVNGIMLARQHRDTLSERRIGRLCSDVNDLARQHLGSSWAKDLNEELTELRKTQSEPQTPDPTPVDPATPRQRIE